MTGGEKARGEWTKEIRTRFENGNKLETRE